MTNFSACPALLRSCLRLLRLGGGARFSMPVPEGGSAVWRLVSALLVFALVLQTLPLDSPGPASRIADSLHQTIFETPSGSPVPGDSTPEESLPTWAWSAACWRWNVGIQPLAVGSLPALPAMHPGSPRLPGAAPDLPRPPPRCFLHG